MLVLQVQPTSCCKSRHTAIARPVASSEACLGISPPESALFRWNTYDISWNVQTICPLRMAKYLVFENNTQGILHPIYVVYSTSYGGSINGDPQNGWFLLGKIPSFEMDDHWGYPHDSGNLHIVSSTWHPETSNRTHKKTPTRRSNKRTDANSR